MNDEMSKTLAINGGPPVRDELLPYGSQCITEEDADVVREAVLDDWITQGPRIDRFEERAANRFDADHAVAFSSGTTALHAAVAAAGVAEGSEAITSPITFAATANAILYNDGTPVFADIDPGTLTLDPDQVKQRITERTDALLAVDFAGHPCAYDELQKIAGEHNLTLIADACHAPGATYKGTPVGSLADMSVLSFHPVKHITTGEGGMVLTDNNEYATYLERFRHHGIVQEDSDLEQKNEGPWYYEQQELGHNFRITDIQCALGLRQLDRLDHFVEQRRDIAATYDRALHDLNGILLPSEAEDITHAYHIYPVQFDLDRCSTDRKTIFNAFRAENIGVQVHYIPVPLHPYYRDRFGYEEGDYPNAEHYYNRTITLPLFPAMTEQDVRDVLTATHKIHRYYF